MFEIRFHGRGGQGAVTAAEVLAQAAFLEKKYAQSFPQFGTERRGAPVAAFCRISDKKINIHSQIYQPDCVVVLDISLLKTVDIAAGLKKNGWLVLNTSQKPGYPDYFDRFGIERIATVDATLIALSKELGSEKTPIVNTTILGALVRATKIVRLQSLIEAIFQKIEQKKEANAAACAKAFIETKIHIFNKDKGGEESESR